MELCSLGNTYFDAKAPWKEKDKSKVGTTLRCCMELLKALALISYPIIPDTAEKLWKLLGYSTSITDYTWDEMMKGDFDENQQLSSPKPLFQKVEDEVIIDELEKLNC